MLFFIVTQQIDNYKMYKYEQFTIRVFTQMSFKINLLLSFQIHTYMFLNLYN